MLIVILTDRLPVDSEVLDVHAFEDRLLLLALLPLDEHGLPVAVGGPEGQGLEGCTKAVGMKGVGFLEPDVNVFDLELEVIDDFFS